MAEPKVLTFVCNWCSYGGADQAGGLKLDYPSGIRLVRVMCSGRVDAQLVVKAFRAGARQCCWVKAEVRQLAGLTIRHDRCPSTASSVRG